MNRFFVLLVGLCTAASAAGDEIGFLTDYSLLEFREGDFVERIYVIPNAVERLGDFNAVMVDQPEIFIAPDSKYKGAKGDQLKALADVTRFAMIERLELGGYSVTDEPGPGVMYLRFAVAEVYLRKKKRGFLSYTPIGLVVHATAQAAVKDLWKKIDIEQMRLEIEAADSVTGEVLAAGTSTQGVRKAKGQEQDVVTWEELDAMFNTLGERVRCHLDNARLPEDQWEVCTDILIEPEVPEEG